MVIKSGSIRILTPQHLTPWQSMYKGNTAFSCIVWFSFLIKTLISSRYLDHFTFGLFGKTSKSIVIATMLFTLLYYKKRTSLQMAFTWAIA